MRWFDVFVSVLKRMGYKVEYEEKWDGDEEKIFVVESCEKKTPLWEFVDALEQSKHELLKDFIYLVTQHFDARVKNFITHILMGKGKEKVPIQYYSYRVEYQIRGMPHIHGAAWINKSWLQKELQITGY